MFKIIFLFFISSSFLGVFNMSKICPNCRKENDNNSINCVKCQNPLDITDFIKTKKFKKDSFSNMANIIGNDKENEINQEIIDFIYLYQEFADYDKELKSLKSSKIDLSKSKQFKDKYEKPINRLNQFKYINIIKGDSDLKRMFLELSSIKHSFNDYDKKIDGFNKRLDATLEKISEIDKFEEDLETLLGEDEYIDTERKDQIIYNHKLTYDYFDRREILELPLGDKQSKVDYLLNNYKNLNSLVEKHNKEFEKKEFLKSLSRYEITIDKFNEELEELKKSDEYIDGSKKNQIQSKYKVSYDYLDKNIYSVSLDYKLNNKINDFLNKYDNLDNFIRNINNSITLKRKEEEINRNLNQVKEFNKDLEELLSSPFYVTWKDKKDLKAKYEKIYNIIHQGKTQDKISLKPELNKFLDDYNLLDFIVEDRNNKFVENELLEHKDLFDDIENFNLTEKELKDPERKIKSLDEKQRRAVVTNELSNQIVAGAGCGKTLTVLGKVRYLIERKGINPNEILCLSYSNKSVNDLKDKLPDGIYTYTFHGLGRSILLANDRPARPDEHALTNFIRIYFKENVIENEKLCEKILEFYAYYLYNLIDEDEVSSLGELYDMEEGRDFTTLRELYGKDKEKVTLDNRTVKSLEELVIANYYFMHQINYEYEPAYKVVNKNYNSQKQYISNLIYNVPSINEILIEDLLLKSDEELEDLLDENPVLSELYDNNDDFIELISLKGLLYDNEVTESAGSSDDEEDEVTGSADSPDNEEDEVPLTDILKEIIENYDELIQGLAFNFNYEKIHEKEIKKFMDQIGIKETEINREYTPDFYLPDYDIYHEHFGVNRNCEAKFLEGEESKKYTEGIKWKRSLHNEKGTELLETYSYYMKENRLLQRLEEKLKDEGVEIKDVDFRYLVSKIAERDEVNKYKDFMKLITGFIELFKGNNYTVDKFDEFRAHNNTEENQFTKKRNELFLDITEDVFISYENYLKANEKIDFNDMINHATALVEAGKLNNRYKYIIVDEYQDTSYTRYDLLKAIQNAVSAKVCVVGDDWQSIYRFSGCDVSLFKDFEKFFENPEIMTIDTTYRNSQELIDISGEFVKKNPQQIQKSLNSKKDNGDETKPVKIAYYNKKSTEEKIKVLEYVVNRIAKDSKQILILGRNNFDIDSYLRDKDRVSPFRAKGNTHDQIIYEGNEDLEIRYITVHGSKGLEEDNVILINLENKVSGFPNQKVDDPILDFVISDSDQFEYGEERRLFYVALTRTKNNVYLLAPESETDKSVFVKELEEDMDKLDIITKEEIFGDEEEAISENPDEFMKDKKVYSIKTKLKCPVCKNGEISLVILNRGNNKTLLKFFECSHDRCEWEGGFYNSDIEFLDEIEICPDCGAILQPFDGKFGPYLRCNNRECGHSENMSGEKLERFNEILRKIDENTPKEIVKTELKCPKCGEGHVQLEINKEDEKKRHFKCSNDSCNWNGGKTFIKKEDLDKVEPCPKCDGLLVPRKAKSGNCFKGCSNYPNCKETKPMDDDSSDNSNDRIATKLICPSCGKGNVVVEINKKSNSKHFKCSEDSCNWTGGRFNQEIKYLDFIEGCPSCDGILYPRKGKRGLFLGCSNFPKCRQTKQFNENEVKSQINPPKTSQSTASKQHAKDESDFEEIKTKLICPECNSGTVILKRNKRTGRGKFVCSQCKYDGGDFNQDIDKLSTLEYCTSPGCNGLTYMAAGKFGEFRTCSNYFKTKCDANRSKQKQSNSNNPKSNYSNTSSKRKNVGKYDAIETKLDCPICGNGKVTLLKNKETGKGFFKCSNDSCSYEGGPFNQDTILLKSLDYCPVPGCNGLTYVKNGKYGPFKVCTYYVKTKCNAGRK